MLTQIRYLIQRHITPNLPMCDQPNVPDPWVEGQIKWAISQGYMKMVNGKAVDTNKKVVPPN